MGITLLPSERNLAEELANVKLLGQYAKDILGWEICPSILTGIYCNFGCFLYDYFRLCCRDFYFLNRESFPLNHRKFIKKCIEIFSFSDDKKLNKELLWSVIHSSRRACENNTTNLGVLSTAWETDYKLRYFLCPFLARVMIRALAHKRLSKTSAHFTRYL